MLVLWVAPSYSLLLCAWLGFCSLSLFDIMVWCCQSDIYYSAWICRIDMFVQKVIWLLDDLCWVLIVVLICCKTFDFRFVDSFNTRLLLSVGWNSMVYDSSLFLLYLLLLRILWLISLWFLYWLMTYCVLRVTPSVCCFCRPLMLGLICALILLLSKSSTM